MVGCTLHLGGAPGGAPGRPPDLVVLVIFENLPVALQTIPLGILLYPWVAQNPQRNSL